MKEDFDKLLSEIDVEIAKIDLYGNDIIETSLSSTSLTKYHHWVKK